MIIYGFCKGYKYNNDGTLLIKVRVPSIHGAYDESQYKGKVIRNRVLDKDLPYYQSLLLPHLPNEGEVVALTSIDEKSTKFLVIGLTGGYYNSTITNIGEDNG